MSDSNVWVRVLALLREQIESEEFRRWFSTSAYASDSGDQITVWVSSAADGRHIARTYIDRIDRALTAIGRADTAVRFVATGFTGEDDDELDE